MKTLFLLITFSLCLSATSFSQSNTFPKKGNVGIGTTNPDALLSVNGQIHAKSVKVDLDNWPDYVFASSYNLVSLQEIEAFIIKNKHLKGMPTAKDVESDGVNLGEVTKALLEKVEELTLHLIEKDNQVSELMDRQELLEERLKVLLAKIDKLGTVNE